jgi:hypothetical protein
MAAAASLDAAAVVPTFDSKGDGKGKNLDAKRSRTEASLSPVVEEAQGVSGNDIKGMFEQMLSKMNSMNAQMHTVTDQMNNGFNDLREGLERTDSRLRVFGEDLVKFKLESAAKWEEFDRKLAELEEKYQTDKKNIDSQLQEKVKQIEDLLANNSRPSAGVLASPQVDPWAQYARTRGGAQPAARPRASSLPPVSHELGYDPCKLWVKGYRRALMREKLIKQFESITSKLPEDLRMAARHHVRGPSAVISFSMPDPESAKSAFEALRTKLDEWIDPVSNITRTLKIYRDQRPEDRTATRVVSQMWNPVIDALRQKGKWVEGMRLLNNQRQLWIVEDDEPYPLFRISFPSKDEYVISVEPNTKAHYGFTDEEMAAIRAKGQATRSHGLPAQTGA